MAILSTRQGRAVLLGVGGALCFTAAVIGWSVSRRVPLVETRRFLEAPLPVGDVPPAAPAPAAPPGTVEARLAAAHDAFAAGRYAEAADAFAWVVARDPRGPHAGEAQWNLTRARLRHGDATAALDALEGLTGGYAGWLGTEAPALREGLERMAAGDLAGARAAYERMTREQPDSDLVPLAHALVARVHWAHGEPFETVRAFARMFASVHDRVPAYADLARSLDRYAGGDERAAEEFARLARSGPDGFRDVYQYLAARSLLEQSRFEEARDALDELRRAHPEGDFSHIVDLEHAWNLLRHGQAAEALVVFERLERTPAPAQAGAFDRFFDLRAELPMGVARAQLALGNWDAAAAAFERARAADPEGMYAVENGVGSALAYERLGRFDRAAALLRDVLGAHPDEPQRAALEQQLARLESRLPSHP